MGFRAESLHCGAVVFVEEVDAVGACAEPAGGASLILFEGEGGAFGGCHFVYGDEFVFGGGAVVAGENRLFTKEHGATGATLAGQFHEGRMIELVAAERALRDDEAAAESRASAGRICFMEPGRKTDRRWAVAGRRAGRY